MTAPFKTVIFILTLCLLMVPTDAQTLVAAEPYRQLSASEQQELEHMMDTLGVAEATAYSRVVFVRGRGCDAIKEMFLTHIAQDELADRTIVVACMDARTYVEELVPGLSKVVDTNCDHELMSFAIPTSFFIVRNGGGHAEMRVVSPQLFDDPKWNELSSD